MDRILNSQQAADKLGIVTKTLHNHTVPKGTIPVVRIGRCVRYSEAALDQWVRDNTESATPESQEVASCQ